MKTLSNFTFFPLSLRSGTLVVNQDPFKACVDSCIASSVSFLYHYRQLENMGPVKAVAAFISKRNLKTVC